MSVFAAGYIFDFFICVLNWQPNRNTAHTFTVQFSDGTCYTFSVDPNVQAYINRQVGRLGVDCGCSVQ